MSGYVGIVLVCGAYTSGPWTLGCLHDTLKSARKFGVFISPFFVFRYLSSSVEKDIFGHIMSNSDKRIRSTVVVPVSHPPQSSLLQGSREGGLEEPGDQGRASSRISPPPPAVTLVKNKAQLGKPHRPTPELFRQYQEFQQWWSSRQHLENLSLEATRSESPLSEDRDSLVSEHQPMEIAGTWMRDGRRVEDDFAIGELRIHGTGGQNMYPWSKNRSEVNSMRKIFCQVHAASIEKTLLGASQLIQQAQELNMPQVALLVGQLVHGLGSMGSIYPWTTTHKEVVELALEKILLLVYAKKLGFIPQKVSTADIRDIFYDMQPRLLMESLKSSNVWDRVATSPSRAAKGHSKADADRNCYQCGEPGHFARDCTAPECASCGHNHTAAVSCDVAERKRPKASDRKFGRK